LNKRLIISILVMGLFVLAYQLENPDKVTTQFRTKLTILSGAK
jgi:hypothetical protein